MAKFIALRRRLLSQTAGLGGLSFEEKRSQIMKEAASAEHSEELSRLGLVQAQPASTQAAEEPHDRFQQLGYVGAYVVETTSEATADQARAALEHDCLIVPDIQLGLPGVTISQRFQRLPRGIAAWPEESGVGLAHKNGVTGRGVLVGVLDTGCDADHSALRRKRVNFRYVPFHPTSDKIRDCLGFDVDGHGTHVCGIIAGQYVGVAPDVDLMVASVIESETMKTSLERIMVALNWMLSQFQLDENVAKPTIINMSLGFLPHWISAPEVQSVMEGITLILSTLLVDFNVLPVVAIGNDGPGTMRAPGYFPESLSVGAVDFDRQPASFSGGGISPLTGDPEPKIAGYGVNVLSSLERNAEKRSFYAKLSGTSMATPYVTGIAALYASADPQLQGNTLSQRLIDEAMPLEALTNRVGAGLARFN